jgi:plasmid stabilization system protein ParE
LGRRSSRVVCGRKKIKFHREARIDLKEAKALYRHHSPLTAAAFAREVEAAVLRCATAQTAPRQYPAGEHGTREHVLPWRFPYTIVYRAHPGWVVIVAVAHQSREPGYWRDRK